mmetsp:Transcript_815/g.2331  ORF Transcript_815/g.2331 Transcript_815/m.2331 type:complete len:377 (+) Transcript_815:179-1309(+)
MALSLDVPLALPEAFDFALSPRTVGWLSPGSPICGAPNTDDAIRMRACICCMPIACIPIWTPMCSAAPHIDLECGQSFPRWSPPHCVHTHSPLRDEVLCFLFGSSRVLSSFERGRLSVAFLESVSPTSFDQLTRFEIASFAFSRCSGSPKIKISPVFSSWRCCTWMSAPVLSMIFCTVSPPRPITRPTSCTFTRSLHDGASPSTLTNFIADERSSFRTASVFAYVTCFNKRCRARSCAALSPERCSLPLALSTKILTPDSRSTPITVAPRCPITRGISSLKTSTSNGEGEGDGAFRFFAASPPSSTPGTSALARVSVDFERQSASASFSPSTREPSNRGGLARALITSCSLSTSSRGLSFAFLLELGCGVSETAGR